VIWQSSEECRQQLPDAGSDLRFYAVINDHRTGHPGADQHIWRNVRQMNTDADPLRQPHLGEGRVHVGKELGSIAIILIGDAPGNAIDPCTQGGRSAHETNIGW
jgi:hypothetical protein